MRGNPPKSDEEEASWTSKDIARGALLFAVGSLAVAYALLAMWNGFPFVFWALAWILGPLLLVVGGNAIYRGLRSSGSDETSA